jgi:hypothetical protein
LNRLVYYCPYRLHRLQAFVDASLDGHLLLRPIQPSMNQLLHLVASCVSAAYFLFRQFGVNRARVVSAEFS